ncbi:phosphohydrolase [Polymorphobacter sp. PAMC 29334]|uniref:phosphohydrolase n=1 Tax=Polymorphobacter sp. PAMC 29334 TaxID=2862331 RepID=UPI00351D319D
MMTTTIKHQHLRPFVLLPSGSIIDLAAPLATSWTDTDLAIGLARTCRWGGHSAWKRPLSVAQHSLTVLAIRERDTRLEPPLALYELLHDAEEGLIAFDCIAPLKAFLGEPFRELCRRLARAVADRYKLPTLSPQEWQQHKAADRIAAASEALHVVRWSAEQIRDTLAIEDTPLMRDPLMYGADRDDYVAWEPWTSEYAAEAWLARLQLELARAGLPS